MDHKGADAAYHLASGEMITVTSSCEPEEERTLEDLTNGLLLGMRNMKRRSERKRLGRWDGLRTHVQGTLNQKMFYLDLFVARQAGCVFDFVLMSPFPLAEKVQGSFYQWIEENGYGNRP